MPGSFFFNIVLSYNYFLVHLLTVAVEGFLTEIQTLDKPFRFYIPVFSIEKTPSLEFLLSNSFDTAFSHLQLCSHLLQNNIT